MEALSGRARVIVVLVAQVCLAGGQVAAYLNDLAGLWHGALAALQAVFALALVFGPKKVGALVEDVGDAVRGHEHSPPKPPKPPGEG